MSNPSTDQPAATGVVRRSAGRPRKETTRVKILQAANAILEEEGIAGFTVEAVAARAGAGKTTIYRWWPTKGALAVAGFLAETAPKIPYKPSGTAREQITAQLKRVAEVYSGKTGKVLAALIAEGQRDAGTVAAFIEGYARPRREEGKEILLAGIERGELRPDLDLEVALDALYGPVYYRILVPLNPLDAAAAERIADHVFMGLALASS
ncbi:TetR/AcrR family transcriptional regulator [Acuticoccus sp. MNP-M23]|uniref:TetR/AcrR family transcriptional regulator n=1 Tax=Acuticoccus sp. MNP-M23 TaxID=3072793 RepID=UPI0028161E0D|nr:TetR/AcrR family transcriptional regulator [Acuticoccus sp. MNP-M23]WMS41334.1 TetR/AcrR family transcriptional regulator [Acuticoccus sp. MNP-M23]